MSFEQASEDYQRIEKAIYYLNTHVAEQPGLEDIAASVGLSEFHFQRLFSQWVGISPKRFLQFLTKECAKEMLDRSTSVLETSFSAGLSGPGRLHDLFITWEAVTPGEYKNRGDGLKINYGLHPTPFGECLLAMTDRGICGLFFVQGEDRQEVVDDLHFRWGRATLNVAPQSTAPVVEKVFAAFNGQPTGNLPLHLFGTNFQLKVWEGLLQIPPGNVASYEEVATWIEHPAAVRAVSGAVARNPISYLIPCHRVIRKIGSFGGYRWGITRKQALFGWEMARFAA